MFYLFFIFFIFLLSGALGRILFVKAPYKFCGIGIGIRSLAADAMNCPVSVSWPVVNVDDTVVSLRYNLIR